MLSLEVYTLMTVLFRRWPGRRKFWGDFLNGADFSISTDVDFVYLTIPISSTSVLIKIETPFYSREFLVVCELRCLFGTVHAQADRLNLIKFLGHGVNLLP